MFEGPKEQRIVWMAGAVYRYASGETATQGERDVGQRVLYKKICGIKAINRDG